MDGCASTTTSSCRDHHLLDADAGRDARARSSGTVAESCSAMPVESKTVMSLVGRSGPRFLPADDLADLAGEVRLRSSAPRDSGTLISPSVRHWRMSSTKTRARCRMRGRRAPARPSSRRRARRCGVPGRRSSRRIDDRARERASPVTTTSAPRTTSLEVGRGLSSKRGTSAAPRRRSGRASPASGSRRGRPHHVERRRRRWPASPSRHLARADDREHRGVLARQPLRRDRGRRRPVRMTV